MPRRVAALGALVLSVLFAGAAQAGVSPWTFTDLKPINGTLSHAFDVNLAGQATGVMTDESGSARLRGFFYDPAGGLVDIGDLGGQNTFAVALNERGVVTGTSQTDNGACTRSCTRPEWACATLARACSRATSARRET